MRPKEFLYLLWYSVRTFFTDVVELILELRNPKSISYILLGIMFIAAYYRNYRLLYILAPVVLFIKIARDRIEGKFTYELFERDLKNGKNSNLVMQYFHKYTKKCSFANKLPLKFDEWKEEEIKKIESNTEQDTASSQS